MQRKTSELNDNLHGEEKWRAYIKTDQLTFFLFLSLSSARTRVDLQFALTVEYIDLKNKW